MPIKYVTESDISFEDAFLMVGDRFVLLNMYPDPDGIWYVDKEHSQWPQIKEAATLCAKTFGDKKQLEKLEQ